MSVHIRKFGIKHKVLCGKWIGKLSIRDDQIVSVDNPEMVTCEGCKKKLSEGKR